MVVVGYGMAGTSSARQKELGGRTTTRLRGVGCGESCDWEEFRRRQGTIGRRLGDSELRQGKGGPTVSYVEGLGVVTTSYGEGILGRGRRWDQFRLRERRGGVFQFRRRVMERMGGMFKQIRIILPVAFIKKRCWKYLRLYTFLHIFFLNIYFLKKLLFEKIQRFNKVK